MNNVDADTGGLSPTLPLKLIARNFFLLFRLVRRVEFQTFIHPATQSFHVSAFLCIIICFICLRRRWELYNSDRLQESS